MAAIDGYREVDDATHRGFRDDHVVERRILAHRVAVADDPRGQEHPLFDGHPARQVGLESGEHLIERRGGEEPEPAQVHSEERDAQVADRSGHREEGPVAAEDDQQIHLRRQLRLAGCRRDLGC